LGGVRQLRPVLFSLQKLCTRRPLSTTGALLATLMIIYALTSLFQGDRYPLSVDATTLIMVGILFLRALQTLSNYTDTQTFALSMTTVISFIFSYEALYKFSFYLSPWRMPPEELKWLIIEVALASTILTGFSFAGFRINLYSAISIMVFIALWAFWLMVGYPQFYEPRNFHPPLINIGQLSPEQIYIINRVTKATLLLSYIFILPSKKK